MKYCQQATTKHKLAQKYKKCIKKINNILAGNSEDCSDYKSINFQGSAIDVDCVAKNIQPNPKTIDMAVSLNNNSVLGIELKFNVKGIPFKEKIENEILAKKEDSKKLLNFQKLVIIVCKKRAKQYYKRAKKNKKNISQKGYEIQILEDFKKNYF